MIADKLKHFDFPENIEIEIFAEEGEDQLEVLLRWALIKDVDLIIMGRKETLEGNGSLAKGIAKKPHVPS